MRPLLSCGVRSQNAKALTAALRCRNHHPFRVERMSKGSLFVSVVPAHRQMNSITLLRAAVTRVDSHHDRAGHTLHFGFNRITVRPAPGAVVCRADWLDGVQALGHGRRIDCACRFAIFGVWAIWIGSIRVGWIDPRHRYCGLARHRALFRLWRWRWRALFRAGAAFVFVHGQNVLMRLGRST